MVEFRHQAVGFDPSPGVLTRAGDAGTTHGRQPGIDRAPPATADTPMRVPVNNVCGTYP
jgi:hypothetical protein